MLKPRDTVARPQILTIRSHAKRCVLARHLADLHSDPLDALDWNLAALEVHRSIHRGDLVPIGIGGPAVFAPSLHLSVGND